MRPRLYLSILAVAVMSATFTASAIPAKKTLHTLRQADGTEISVRLVGDEHFHYYTTDDGYLLSRRDGNFYYATFDDNGSRVVASSIIAADASSRSVEARSFLAGIDTPALIDKLGEAKEAAPSRKAKGQAVQRRNIGLYPGSSFPATGSPKVLVILVQYNDVAFSAKNPYDHFSRMLNEEEFSDYKSIGSARDWYIEASNGLFTPDFDVYGPVKLSKARSYYGGNDAWGNDKHPEMMAIEACQQLDSEVDFSQYDCDGDGMIDNVYIYYAGVGEADSSVEDSVWPHSWNVSAATSKPYMFDGVRLDRYACSNEWTSGVNRPDLIGTFVHEFGHVLGLPDLYDTEYGTSFTPGAWDIMDYGSYNADGAIPPTFSAFERYALGWIEPVELTNPMRCSLGYIGHTNEAYIAYTDDPAEFFLFENRQKTRWDVKIPGHGMLVWHIDYDDETWNNNSVNNKSSHQRVDLIEADDRRSDSNRANDSFPGTKNVTEFTFESTPDFATWGGDDLGLPITEIAESADGIITFIVGNPEAGITGITPDDDEAPLYYNLQGVRVDNPTSGIYIRLTGPTATKVLVN